MNRLLTLLLALPCAALGFTADDNARTILTDGTASDTASAVTYVDGKNQDNWIMTIGSAGGSYNWATDVNFNITDQDWAVVGASSSDRPTITVTSSVDVTGGGANGKTIYVGNIHWRVTAGTVNGILVPGGGAGDADSYCITNCTFQNDGGGEAFSIGPATGYGVIADCDFAGSSETRIYLQNAGVGWTGVMSFGTTDTVTIEDCNFNNTSTTMSQVIDGDNGCRYIFRHNIITNGNTETHGFTSGDGNEGLQIENYSNVFWLSGTGGDQADWVLHVFRGGTGVVYSNEVKQANSFGGFNHWVKFRAEQTAPYLAPHQPGTGLVSPSTVGRIPIYCWDNVAFEACTFSCFTTSEGTMVENTDYFTDTEKPGYVPLEYPHPLRNAQAEVEGSTTAGAFGSIKAIGNVKLQGSQ